LIFNNSVGWLKYLLLEQGKKLLDCFGLGDKDDGLLMHIYEFRERKFVLCAVENVFWQSDNIKGVLDSLRRDDPKMPEGVMATKTIINKEYRR